MRIPLRSASTVSRRLGRRTYSSPPKTLPSAVEAIKAHPPKIIPDYLTPMPSHLLTTTLTDLISPQTPTSSSPKISSPPIPLPQGHHLVYFPIQLPPSKLIPDGADPDHSPGPPFTRRVWAGGEVVYGKRWREMTLSCSPVVCREKVEDVSLRGREGEEKVFVDVWRRYGIGHDQVEERREWEIEERRTLVFMREEETSTSSPPRLIKCKFLYQRYKVNSADTFRPPSSISLYIPHSHGNSPLPLLSPLLQRALDPHRPRLRARGRRP